MWRDFWRIVERSHFWESHGKISEEIQGISEAIHPREIWKSLGSSGIFVEIPGRISEAIPIPIPIPNKKKNTEEFL